ncbi:MAG: Ig-like domain-containing protein [Achromobacter sp.]|uniref:Ig-like domain-containing protein n=1 Tax=Achromobacter sp. TaxID=134375 RepID=UPI003D02256F
MVAVREAGFYESDNYSVTLRFEPAKAKVHRKNEDDPSGLHPTPAEIIYAKATITPKTPGLKVDGLTVAFEVTEGDAFFYAEGVAPGQTEQNCTETTDVSGTATAALICETPETGYMQAVLTFSPLDKQASDEESFEFVGPNPKFRSVEVSAVNAFADDTPRVKVRAIVEEDGELIDEAEVKFRNDGHAATFSGEPGQNEVVRQAVNGVAQAVLQSAKPEFDYLVVSLEEDPRVRERVSYRFLAKPTVSLVLEQDGAPADGNSQIVAVFVAKDSQTGEPMAGVEVQFALTGAAKFLDTENKPVVTDAKGEARAPFVSLKKNTAADDASKVSVVVTGGDPQTYAREAHYTFNNAWAGISKITATFGGVGSATIFKNGRHQAALVLIITLIDATSRQLTDDNSPEFSQFLNNVWFTDYYSREELSWLTFSAVKNQFSAQLNSGRAAGAAIDPPPPGSHGIENGVVRLTYYVSCAERPASAVDIGQRFRPTAGCGVNVAPPDNHDIYNADGADEQGGLSERATLTLLSAITYTPQDLDWQATLLANADTNDEGITDPSAPAPEGNCSRQIDYTCRLTGATVAKYGAKIYEVRVDKNQYSALDGYCAGYNGEHLYTHAAYFWPMNLKDLDGNPIDGSGARQFPMGEYEVYSYVPGMARFDKDFQGIALTIYGYFGYWYDKNRRRSTRVNITLYDQYGNSGDFHVSTEGMPSKYAEFNAWKPMQGDWSARLSNSPRLASDMQLDEDLPYGLPPWSATLMGNFHRNNASQPQYVCAERWVPASVKKPWWFLRGRDQVEATDANKGVYLFFSRNDKAALHKGVQVWVKDAYPAELGDPAVLLMRDDADNVLGLTFDYFSGATDTWGNVHPIWKRQTIVMQPLRPSGSRYLCTHYVDDKTSECAAIPYSTGDEKFEFTPKDCEREINWTPPSGKST